MEDGSKVLLSSEVMDATAESLIVKSLSVVGGKCAGTYFEALFAWPPVRQ